MNYQLNGQEVTYSKFYDNAREFTPSQVVEAAVDAVENWDWDASDERIAKNDTEVCKEFLSNWDERYVITSFADDDGIVRLDHAYMNIWDWLDEFMISSYRTWQADRVYHNY